MFATRFALAALALVNVALAGAPPACLLGAVQGLPNPADMSAVCDKYQTAVTGNLTEMCSGDDAKSALSAYSATCSLNGIKVKALATSSAAASSTDASSASTTATGKATATTGTSTATATAKASASTKTGTSTASATGSSASETGASTSGGVTTSGASAASQPVTFVVSAMLALGVANLLLL